MYSQLAPPEDGSPKLRRFNRVVAGGFGLASLLTLSLSLSLTLTLTLTLTLPLTLTLSLSLTRFYDHRRLAPLNLTALGGDDMQAARYASGLDDSP